MFNQNEISEEKQPGFNLKEFIFKYLKYIPWLVISTIICLVIAYVQLRYSPIVYQVRAKMMVKGEGGPNSQDRLQNLFMSSGSNNLVDEIEIMKSSAISKRIITALNLQVSYYNKGKVKGSVLHPEDAPFKMEVLFVNDSTQAFGVEVKLVNNSSFLLNNSTKPVFYSQIIDLGSAKVRFTRNLQTTGSFSSDEFTASWQPLYNAAVGIAGSFTINPISDFSNVLLISLQTENTKLGKDIINQLMTEYNISSVEDKRKTTQYTIEFIDESLVSLKSDLGNVEQNLQNFREKNRAINLEQQSGISFGELSANTSSLTNQELQLKIISYLQNYLSDNRNWHKTVPTQLGIQEPSLQTQIQGYNAAQLKRESELRTTPAANPLIEGLDEELENLRNQIVENLKNIQQSYLISRNNILDKARKTETDISSVPGKTKQLLEITRQQKILEDLYSFLLQKKLETSISSASTISSSKVVEPAFSPGEPVSPNKKRFYIVGFFLGLAIPIAIIAVVELLNDKIRNRGEIEKGTNVPLLGEIGHSDQTDTLVVSKNNRKFIAEQFRIIRTNLHYLLNKVEKPVILITSSYSGEGKSFISTNIGAVMALTGKKTVILEFDIRKPKIISGLDLNRKSGITNFIVGNASIEEIIIPIKQVENLYVIPCGPVPPNPAELLLDEKVRELFIYLRRQFDVIIVDSAPVGLVTDAVILSQYADATMYIMRQDYTLKKQLSLINELHTNKKLPKLSVILNDVKTTGNNKRYYGGYGYGYGYGSSYFDQETRKRKSFLQRVTSIFSKSKK